MLQSSLVIGELTVHFEGYGFVVPTKLGSADVFIPARAMGDALHGDIVEVKIKQSKSGLFEGKIVRILKRGLRSMVGRLEQHGKKWIVLGLDQRVRHPMRIEKLPAGFKSGDHVVARVTQYPGGDQPMQGEVIEKLPERGTLQAEIEYVIAKHQWPKIFPKSVEEEAQQLYDTVRTTYDARRKDLRALPFVTIDGDDAKDFDDAVCAEVLGYGQIRVWVAIADVAHYVTPGSAIDREAYQRGTSVYFPGRVLPMLPEVLSNDLCSLKPSEDRLAMVAEWVVDETGAVSEERFYSAVFQSQARLTYQIVQKILVEKEEKFIEQYRPLVPMLETLSKAAQWLKTKKKEQGCLDFDLPESEVVLDFTGGIADIEKSERYWSHQIIEELMIAANEAVARFLTAKKLGCVYRIHEGPNPDKIRLFYKIAHHLGFRGPFPNTLSSKSLMKILRHFKNHPEERFVNTLLLRSMAQAVYSSHNIGHFGLASACYCHFTSPIRRYPDLIVHRLLKTVLEERPMDRAPQTAPLEEMAETASILERKAMAAEREMLSLHKTLFMSDKKNQIFDGIISHVTKFGFFVELLEFFVEGLVPKTELKGQYVFDEEHLTLKGKGKKEVFRIGDPVKIRVGAADIPERKLYFKLLDTLQNASIR